MFLYDQSLFWNLSLCTAWSLAFNLDMQKGRKEERERGKDGRKPKNMAFF